MQNSITVQRETYDQYIDDVLPLYEDHWREVCWRRENFVLNPDHEKYRKLEAGGALRIFTARENGIIIGYALFVVQHHLHYKDVKIASNDIVFVDPARRGHWLGIKLLRHAINSMKAEGVKAVSLRMKKELAWGPIARRLGFEPVEEIWNAWVGG